MKKLNKNKYYLKCLGNIECWRYILSYSRHNIVLCMFSLLLMCQVGANPSGFTNGVDWRLFAQTNSSWKWTNERITKKEGETFITKLRKNEKDIWH